MLIFFKQPTSSEIKKSLKEYDELKEKFSLQIEILEAWYENSDEELEEMRANLSPYNITDYISQRLSWRRALVGAILSVCYYVDSKMEEYRK